MTHTISVILENKHGALARVAGLFASRGYNITSLNVAETDDPTLSRMTIVVSGNEEIIEQIVKQLNKLIDVVKVYDFCNDPLVERELILVRINANGKTRHEIISVISMFGGKIASVSKNSIVAQLSGTEDEIDNFITLVKTYGIKDIARTGKLAIPEIKK